MSKIILVLLGLITAYLLVTLVVSAVGLMFTVVKWVVIIGLVAFIVMLCRGRRDRDEAHL